MFDFLKQNNPANNNLIEELIIDTPNTFNYSPNASIQYATKAFTPININLEITSSDPHIRKQILSQLETSYKTGKNHVDYICGIESGGSYFASALADKLNKKLILLRKTEKIEDSLSSRLVGEYPPKGSRICIIDDVLSTGLTLFHAKKFFLNLGCFVSEVKVIFSYGFEKNISKELGLEITVMSNYKNLIKIATDKNKITKKDAAFLNKYVGTLKDYLSKMKIV